ncbi:MAG: ECF-type sigma factor [Gammaproteobacteria bacterium]
MDRARAQRAIGATRCPDREVFLNNVGSDATGHNSPARAKPRTEGCSVCRATRGFRTHLLIHRGNGRESAHWEWCCTVMDSDRPITQMLKAAARGESPAADEAYGQIYEELKRIARANRRRWRGNETLNTTALIHEAYIRLAAKTDWDSRVHFYATAAKAMRHILIHYLERQQTAKRGGGAKMISVDEISIADSAASEDLLELEQALQRLEAEDERQCRVVECRFFAGMSIEETAEALAVSPATVKRDWLLASTRLYIILAPGSRSR